MLEKPLDGIVVTTVEDMGPSPVLNTTTSLDEVTTMKLGIAGMTLLSMGSGTGDVFEKRHFRLHGPIPVPDNPNLEALAMSFKVKAKDTSDPRIANYGRETTLWLVFTPENRPGIFSKYKTIEVLFHKFLEKITDEVTLKSDAFADGVKKVVEEIFAESGTKSGQTTERQQGQPSIIHEAFTLYSVDNEGIPVKITDYEMINSLDVLLFVNNLTGIIFNIHMIPSITQRRVFLSGRAASKLNLNDFRSQYQIRIASDELEVTYLMEKLETLIQKVSHHK